MFLTGIYMYVFCQRNDRFEMCVNCTPTSPCNVMCALNRHNVYRPFCAFIRDIDRPLEKLYSVAAIEPRAKNKSCYLKQDNLPKYPPNNSSPLFIHPPIKSRFHLFQFPADMVLFISNAETPRNAQKCCNRCPRFLCTCSALHLRFGIFLPRHQKISTTKNRKYSKEILIIT